MILVTTSLSGFKGSFSTRCGKFPHIHHRFLILMIMTVQLVYYLTVRLPSRFLTLAPLQLLDDVYAVYVAPFTGPVILLHPISPVASSLFSRNAWTNDDRSGAHRSYLVLTTQCRFVESGSQTWVSQLDLRFIFAQARMLQSKTPWKKEDVLEVTTSAMTGPEDFHTRKGVY